MISTKKHAFIPDTQITPESDTSHIEAAGTYLADKKPDVIIKAGDWWDMRSLNSYDKPGSFGWEKKSYSDDIKCGWVAMDMFLRNIRQPKGYDPKIIFTVGNHEQRILRAADDPNNIVFRSMLTLESLGLKELGVKVVPFLNIIKLDGILYSHYFNNPQSLTSNAVAGTIENKLKLIGHSFSMGHQQHRQTGSIYTALGERRIGLVCGRFYQEDQDYLSPQKNTQSWSGIFMKHEVRRGEYDLMEVSMKYLLKEWS